MSQLLLGQLGEKYALKKLTAAGYSLVERNFSTVYGELDLIMRDKGELVFVEVKTVSADRGFDPAEQMTPRKLHHLKNTINGYLSLRHISPEQVYRLDFVGIVVGTNDQVLKFDHQSSIELS